MKIEIELENPDNCLGCPCLKPTDPKYYICLWIPGLRLLGKDPKRPIRCLRENGK